MTTTNWNFLQKNKDIKNKNDLHEKIADATNSTQETTNTFEDK